MYMLCTCMYMYIMYVHYVCTWVQQEQDEMMVTSMRSATKRDSNTKQYDTKN